LGELLVEWELVSQEELDQALAEQRRTGEFLGTILIRLGLVTQEQLLPALAEQVGMPYVRLPDLRPEPAALATVSPEVASHYRLLPLRLTPAGSLEVAIADPFDIQTLDELRVLVAHPLRPVLASARDIREAIERAYGLGAQAVARQKAAGEPPPAPAAPAGAVEVESPESAASVLAVVNRLLAQALRERATDIHLEPFAGTLRIRQRIDGVMYELPVPPDLGTLQAAMVSRIKVMANLDIAEKRLPQDGRIRARVEGQELDLRVSILPTAFGEAVEIRLLSPERLISLPQLGLEPAQLTLLDTLLRKPHGILFVTGPTGSGKTTTLYACLTQLNQPAVKILTIEDPIEYQLPGITQLQVHPKIGFSFAQGLRSMLRHDPDIMMVGEVRDPETAEITIRSALTGHLVFSTLHTNDAPGGVTRLVDMGVEPYLLASSVLGFIAQRLVRLCCPACTTPRPTPPGLAVDFNLPTLPPTLPLGTGCPACKGTGYQGRTAIYEFLPLTAALEPLILRRASAPELAAAAAQQPGGFLRLRQAGWQKVLAGLTTPEEVLRVT
jgi:type II secretory ATPase GspE/PulE/Tfp pilus assembly ATPase PilB-like protein